MINANLLEIESIVRTVSCATLNRSGGGEAEVDAIGHRAGRVGPHNRLRMNLADEHGENDEHL